MEISPRVKIKKISGCYILWKNNIAVYVGQSVNIIARVGVHLGEEKIDFDEFSFIELDKPTKEELNELEAELIIRYKPRVNGWLPENKKFCELKLFCKKFGIDYKTIKKAVRANNIFPVFKEYYKIEDLTS